MHLLEAEDQGPRWKPRPRVGNLRDGVDEAILREVRVEGDAREPTVVVLLPSDAEEAVHVGPRTRIDGAVTPDHLDRSGPELGVQDAAVRCRGKSGRQIGSCSFAARSGGSCSAGGNDRCASTVTVPLGIRSGGAGVAGRAVVVSRAVCSAAVLSESDEPEHPATTHAAMTTAADASLMAPENATPVRNM